MEQETLIYIDEKERYDASVAANAFTRKDVKNRAYVNTLGAELALKYLSAENVKTSDIYNIHSIKKILEGTDISDIMLPNIHIDVRVVFDENVIFIPKSHFEYNLVPDIYIVLQLAQDKSHVKFLGFFEPRLINKNNANSDYYFIEKEKLTPSSELVNFINNFQGNKNVELSENDTENSERLIMAMADNDISENDKKYLLEQLTKSAELRDKFIEFENFETLSFKAVSDPEIDKTKLPQDIVVQDEFDAFDSIPSEQPVEETEILAETIGDLTEDVLTETPELESTSEDVWAETPEFDTASEGISNEVSDIATEEISDNLELLNIEETPESENLEISDNLEETIAENLDDKIDSVEKLDFDSVPETAEEILPALDAVDEVLSLDNIAETEITTDTTTVEPIEKMSFNEVEETVIEPIENTAEETVSFEQIETGQLTEPEIEPLSFEDSAVEENTSDNTEVAESIDFVNDVEITDNTENSFEEPIAEDNSERDYDSFGKNLLENLSADDNENISIERVETENSPEDISSDEVLSQIDDVLLTSSADEQTDYVESQENNETITYEQDEEQNDINVLYNEEEATSNTNDIKSLEDEVSYEEDPAAVPGAALFNNTPAKSTNKKTLIVAAALAAVIATASISMFVKPKTEENAEQPANNEITKTIPSDSSAEDILATNAPEVTKPVNTEAKKVVKELKTTTPTQTKSSASEPYMNVSKLIWDVPDNLSYSPKMQSYLRTAGKSIKLSLSADLLLATEYAYTNYVKINLKLDKNGTIQESSIVSGSGSTQIDNIVLQSVKETLNVVKPPADEIKTPYFNLALIIYF